jgi:phospholipid/cholesterol/gamma-HCH transport system substrate-binding protein
MEIRARYVLVGLFVFAVVVASFGFVFWLHNTGGLGERAVYRIRFDNGVSGLRTGSAVLFNGMRVGEVTDLRISRDNPRQVLASVAVERNTPLRADTQVGIEVQGLMGSPSIALKGGAAVAPALAATGGEVPVLSADASAGQDTMQAAREALRRLNDILTDNAAPLHSAIANIDTFSGALARNAPRLDELVEGLVRLTGGGGSKASPRRYDLTAPRSFAAVAKMPSVQLVVADPSVVVALDTQKILVRSDAGEGPSAAEAQWADSIPKLVQARIVQSFENAGYMRVARPLDGFAADRQLLIDIRRFHVVDNAEPAAVVELGAKIVGDNGRVVAARIFDGSVAAKSTDAAGAAAALDQAFIKIATDIVIWTLGAM